MDINKSTRFGTLALAIFFMANLFVVPTVLLNLLHQETSIETSSFLSNVEGPEILEIKINLSLPSNSEWESSKKETGLLEINGEFYTLIEHSFSNDTLYSKYIKNTNARDIFSLLASKVDNNRNSEKNQNSNGSSFLSGWMFLKFKVNANNDFAYLNLYYKGLASHNYSYENRFTSVSLPIDSPPPQIV